jgi:hypothetical protein
MNELSPESVAAHETDPRRYLTPEEVSLRWRGKITPETLANWRSLQIGPPYNKFGKAVLYRVDLLDLWEQVNLFTCDTPRLKEFLKEMIAVDQPP